MKTTLVVRKIVEITVSDEKVVIGRARLDVSENEQSWVHLQQTYGHSRDGTLPSPVKCDLAVLEAFVKAAHEAKESFK